MRQLRNQWAGLLALFLVLTGAGAYAAFDPIGGDGDVDACFQKKSGDLDLLKGKKCGKGEKTVAWSQTGPQGPAGTQGPQGEAGAAGTAGRSALDLLRSGETVRGVVGGQLNAAAGSQEFYVLGTLPVAAPEPLTDANVIVDGNYENTTICQGSYAAPIAPPGRLCVYDSEGPTVGTNAMEEEGTGSGRVTGPASPFGFALRFYSVAAGEVSISATWAYTAP